MITENKWNAKNALWILIYVVLYVVKYFTYLYGIEFLCKETKGGVSCQKKSLVVC